MLRYVLILLIKTQKLIGNLGLKHRLKPIALNHNLSQILFEEKLSNFK